MFFTVLLFIVLIVVNPNNGQKISLPSSNKNCTVKYETRLLNEGQRITTNGKQFKVEDCHLQRAYQTCGTHLWFMLNIVCGAVESQKANTNSKGRVIRFTRANLLSEACCENSCTVAEMTRYCP
jgi:hypothetical protein